MTNLRRAWLYPLLLGIILATLVLWLRGPSMSAGLWNVDEAIHAAAANRLLDGGVLYRDAVDQRTPLSYYWTAAVFALAGRDNLWALRMSIALLITTTALLLGLTARRVGNNLAGPAAALIYAILSSALYYPGDAFAANTEWFVALFSTAAAFVLLPAAGSAGLARWFAAGALLGLSALSKQPGLLDLAGPFGLLVWLHLQGNTSGMTSVRRLLSLLAGWLAPWGFTWLYFTNLGAWSDFVFYTWTYNLHYYGPETTLPQRLAALALPLQLLAGSQAGLLLLWLGGAAKTVHRLLQRQPTPPEQAANPALAYLLSWTLGSLLASAASGRDFQHYTIQFLPAFSFGAGLALAAAVGKDRRWSLARWLLTGLGVLGVAQLGRASFSTRHRTIPADPSQRVSAYIREHSTAQDRIFVWGYHPDIYLFSGRTAAARFLYCSFQTGLVPWTNVAPERDTGYAIVPGAMETLLADLQKSPPHFIVDCSAGPNRHWQKYPLERFPALRDYIQSHYQAVESGQFVPQGFRLFQRREPGEADATPQTPPLPQETLTAMAVAVLDQPVRPVAATAPHGVGFALVEGRAEYFAHAPSELVYRPPAEATALRGGFGLRAAAYGPENPAPSDGAVFHVVWRSEAGLERELWQHRLNPREQAADRGVHSFRVELPARQTGALLLRISPGPADNPASDWTFWTDLAFEKNSLDASLSSKK